MLKFKSIFFVLTMLFVISCEEETTIQQNQAYNTNAILWQQHAAEYRALAHQAFNIAKVQIDNLAGLQASIKPWAVIADIDETVLDNTPYNAKMALLGKEFDKASWFDWGLQKKAKAVPGALTFFNYAAEKGIKIFYISNRYEGQKQETIENLKKLGFPNADAEHVLLKASTSGKEPRRMEVKSTHQIALLLGDNLSDFSEVFDDRAEGMAHENVEKMRLLFGSKFIVFPNAIYGHWETKEIFDGNYDWTPVQKDSIRRAKLIAY
ncbi:MAG: Lipoprotein E [Bacteroidota bacterium]|nr:MAG: Lipoprotein E [Bacteroidota bacterium]